MMLQMETVYVFKIHYSRLHFTYQLLNNENLLLNRLYPPQIKFVQTAPWDWLFKHFAR